MRVPGFRDIVFVLAIIAISCKGDPKPKTDPSIAAGDVRAITGEVTATIDGQTRALAVGDVVAAGDRVRTGADGDVVIELRHNHVRWHLGPDQDRTPLEAAAWHAPPPAAGEISGDRTAVAGRHAEREAADTTASSIEHRDTAASGDSESGSGSGSGSGSSTGSGSEVSDPTPKTGEKRNKGTGGGGGDTGYRTQDPSNDKTPDKPPPDGGCDEVACLLADAPMACCSKYKAKKDPIGRDSIPAHENLDKDDITAAVGKVKSKFLACGDKFADAPKSVKVNVKVSPAGSVTKAEVTDEVAIAGLASCVESAMKTAKFPVTTKGGSFTFPAILR